MNAYLCQRSLSGESGLNGRTKFSFVRQMRLGQQLFPCGIRQFEVTRRQCAEVFHENFANTESDEFRLHWREHGVVTIGPSPFLQHCKLLGLVLQISEDSRQQNVHQIFKRKILIDVDRVCEFTWRAIVSLFVNGLVEESACSMSVVVVDHTSNDLFQVIQESLIVQEMFTLHGATSSGRAGSKLHGGDGSVDNFFATSASQVSGQTRIVSQISQKAFCQPRKLAPLLVGYCRKGLAHFRNGSVSMRLLFPGLRIFRGHSKSRVWRVYRMRELGSNREPEQGLTRTTAADFLAKMDSKEMHYD